MKRLNQILMAGVFAVLSFLMAPSASAETLLWYHFNEHPVGTKAAYQEKIENAAETNLFGGKVEVRLDNHSFGNNNGALPIYTNAFDDGVFLYDPVSKQVIENKTALFCKTGTKGSAANDYLPASCVWVEDYDKLTPSPEYTVELFVRSASTAPTVWRTIFNSAVWTMSAASGNGNLKFSGDGIASQLGGDGVTDGAWHHIAVVHKANKCMLYRDYQKVQYDSNVSTETDYTKVTKLLIGAPTYNDYGAWHGWIDEFRVSDAALDPSQFLRMTVAKTDDASVHFQFTGEDYKSSVFGDFSSLASVLYNYANVSAVNSFPNEAVTSAAKATLFWDSAYCDKPSLVFDGLPGTLMRSGIANADVRRENVALKFTAKDKKSADYDPLSGYLHVDDISSGTLSADSFTSECFVRYDTVPQTHIQYIMWQYGGVNGTQCNSWTLCHGNGANGRFYGQVWYSGDDGIKSVQLWPSDSAQRVSLSDGLWHHVAFVYDKPGKTVSAYLDYRLYAQEANVVMFSDPSPTTNKRSVEFATGYDGALHQMDGALDGIRITRRALDPQEFLTTIPVATGKTLFWAGLDTDMTTLPYPGVSPAGVVAQATAALTGRQKKFKYLDDESAEIEKKAGKSLDLNGGKVDFGRNLMLESERTVTVEFLAKITSKTLGAKLVEFKSGNTSVWSVPADAIPVGMWHTVALKVDAASGTQTLFVDGAQVSSGSVTVPEPLADSSFVLGDDGVVGQLDEVRVSRGLLAAEELFRIDPTGLMLLFR